jgi:hypothetical protein
MLVVFANNQTMAAEAGTSSVITTDPVPLNGNDRASMILAAHYFFGGGGVGPTRTFAVQPEVSNDGVTYVPVGAAISIMDAAETPQQTVRTVNGAFVRMRYTLTCPAAVPNAHICFDHHVNFDHV